MKEISVEQMKKIIDQGREIYIVDVRTVTEFDKGHISGSINIPLDILRTAIGSLMPNKNSRIYMYCLSGSRSNQAVQILETIGYINVYSMKNGLLAWRNNKFPIILE